MLSDEVYRRLNHVRQLVKTRTVVLKVPCSAQPTSVDPLVSSYRQTGQSAGVSRQPVLMATCSPTQASRSARVSILTLDPPFRVLPFLQVQQRGRVPRQTAPLSSGGGASVCMHIPRHGNLGPNCVVMLGRHWHRVAEATIPAAKPFNTGAPWGCRWKCATAAFALSGVMAAARKQLDAVGVHRGVFSAFEVAPWRCR